MISNIDNDLLIKYLRGDLSSSESLQLADWINQKEENKEFLFGLKEAYMLSRWEELRDKADTAEGWSALSETINETSSSFSGKKIMMIVRYAAAAIVIFSFGFLFNAVLQHDDPALNTVSTAYGEQSTVILNDGTKIKLNENSSLTYPGKFSKQTRNVTLSGEAFFEVKHNEKKPFLVHVGAYTVKVLGTKFNVDAYTDKVYSYTSLKEGKIQIIDNSKDSKILSELKPGTQICYNKRTSEYFVTEIDKEEIADWTNGQMVIKRETLEEVAKVLEKKYGYTISIQNNKISKLVYNITIEDESLEEILGNIHFITPQVHYSISKDKKTVIFK